MIFVKIFIWHFRFKLSCLFNVRASFSAAVYPRKYLIIHNAPYACVIMPEISLESPNVGPQMQLLRGDGIHHTRPVWPAIIQDFIPGLDVVINASFNNVKC